VGRGHLNRAAALATVAFLAAAAPAAAALRWRLVAGGPALGSTVTTPVAYVALTRPAVGRFEANLPTPAIARVRGVDFSRDALVAVFAEFGCRDGLIDVSSVEQQGKLVHVDLVEHAPKPATVMCMAIYPTYRLLTVPKAGLSKPYPLRATVTLARA
jgi:hypothetical protein